MIICFLTSCNKSGTEPAPAGVIGTWTWAESSLGNTTYLASASAAYKKVIFHENGTFSLTYNDSSVGSIDLIVTQPAALRVNPVTDSGAYELQLVLAACVNYKYPALLLVGQIGYQYRISGDTLRVARPPCLAPLESVYVRSN